GGNDQIFNLLAGRDLMRAEGMEPQVALTMPLLVGLDGHKKMSKSYGNYVGLTDAPADMFGKLMSIADEIVPMYFRLCSTCSIEEIDQIEADFKAGTADPYQMKRALARNIVDLYHGEGEGQKAQDAFDAQFKKGEMPEDTPEFAASEVVELNDEGLVYLPKLMVACKMAASIGEARRLVDGGGVKVDGKAMAPKTYNVDPALFVAGIALQAGKKRWAKLV
ncbi:MAG: tyrosine--tRNA ligase, partial [Atopobiaceae bacterium]|nr:tyrosine--tRNA ligase [Atopobiaceae bacterium]